MKAKIKKKASHVKNARNGKNRYLSEPAVPGRRRAILKTKETEAGREAQW
jgi:hypothetical protein